MQVPFNDLHRQYSSLKNEIDEAIAEVIAKSAFVRGPFVDAFEESFANAMGARHCVSCANGTDAIYIAMKALGVGRGDEVLTTAHSWIATSETITQTGADVVFCDTQRNSFNIDPQSIEAKITPRTVGIIPVHLAGQPADMDVIMAVAAKRGLWVIEDCAQAHGATFQGKRVGSFGMAGTFSFYPGKNLGAMGDAGAIITEDEALASRMSMYARHGGLKKGEHVIEGVNSRLDGLQAAILSVKLPHINRWNEARRRIAALYDEAFEPLNTVDQPQTSDDRNHVYHLYMIRHERRDELARALAQDGVQTGVNYPVSLPFLPAYARLGTRREEYPNAYFNQSRILSLPMFPEMTQVEAESVVESVVRHCAAP